MLPIDTEEISRDASSEISHDVSGWMVAHVASDGERESAVDSLWCSSAEARVVQCGVFTAVNSCA